MTTIIVLFFIGYLFHLLYKVLDHFMIFLFNVAQKLKKDKLAEPTFKDAAS